MARPCTLAFSNRILGRTARFFFVLLVILALGPQTLGQSKNSQDDSSTSNNQTNNQKNNSQSSQQKDITVGDGTGKIESYLLATAAVHQAAVQIANKLAATNAGKKLVIYDQKEQDKLAALAQFRMQYSILHAIYSLALTPLPELSGDLVKRKNEYSAESATGVVGELSTAAQAAVQLLSLFKSTITTGGIDVTLDDEILIAEVSKALGPLGIITLRPTLYYPSVFDETKIASSTILTNLETLFQDKQSSLEQISSLQSDIYAINAALKEAPDQSTKDTLNSFLQPRITKLNQLKAANLTFDSMVSVLMGSGPSAKDKAGTDNSGDTNNDDSSTDDNKDDAQQIEGASVPSSQVTCDLNDSGLRSDFSAQSAGPGSVDVAPKNPQVKKTPNGKISPTTPKSTDQSATIDNQHAPSLADLIFADLLEGDIKAGNLILTLHIQQSGGGYLTKSNLFTFFGGTKLYHMGGSVVSFTLREPNLRPPGVIVALGRRCPKQE